MPAADADAGALRFAPLRTRALDGTDHRLPDDLPARRTLVVIAYRQRHQRDVDAWIALAVAAGVPPTPRGRALPLPSAVVEVPFLSGAWRPARRLIDGGMAQGIADPDVLARTLTAYGSPAQHRRACGLGTDGTCVEAMVVTRDSAVLAHCSGAPAAADRGAVEALLAVLTAR